MSLPRWSCVTLKRFSAKARERLSSRQSVWLQVLRGDHWHRHGDCRRRTGRKLQLMCGFEVWSIVQGAYAQYASKPCGLTTLKHFSLSWEMFPIAGVTSLQFCTSGCSWTSKPTHSRRDGEVATVFIRIHPCVPLNSRTGHSGPTFRGMSHLSLKVTLRT